MENRDCQLPPIFPSSLDVRNLSKNIVTAHEVIREALQQYLNVEEADLGAYLKQMSQRSDPYVDEYGQEILSYKKVFRFIWKQYNETKVQNYAIKQFDKDKLDLCSVARYLSHQPVVQNRETILKIIGKALNYTCHPCTPYKRKEHGKTFIPNIEDICPSGCPYDFTPEKSIVICRGYDEHRDRDTSTLLSNTTTGIFFINITY